MPDTTGPPPRVLRMVEPVPMVLIPHVKDMLRPEVDAWAKAQDIPVNPVALDPTNLFAYGELLYQHWNGMADLIVVEQDVIPPDLALDRFATCPMPWCTHPYLIDVTLHERVLGCTRFTAKLQRAFPHLMFHAARNKGGMREHTEWYTLNEQIIRYLDINRILVHAHTPPAIHLHDYEVNPRG